MSKNEFEAILEKFNLLVAGTQEQLTEIMSMLESSKVPSKEKIDALDVNFEELRTNYEEAVALAKEQLLERELPLEGSGLKEYAIAVENSATIIIRQQIEKARILLTRFTRIRAKLSEYALALKPYQETAAELLKELSEESIDGIMPDTAAPEAFLNAIDTENIHSPEGFALLEEVSKHYPRQVQWGLSGGYYYVEASDNENDSAVSEESTQGRSPIPKETNDTANDTAEVVNVAETDIKETTDANVEPCNPQTIIDSEPDLSEAVSHNTPIDNNDVVFHETLKPVNKIKTSKLSASSFKKEIKKMGKNFREIRFILPLLTNVGILTKEQAFLFGVCIDHFDETDKSRNTVEISINALVQKGYLACYRYDADGREEEAYCLASYCYNCLCKDSISAQMERFWTLSFGKYKLIGDNILEKTYLLDVINKNDSLLQYLYSEKRSMDGEDFQIVMQSIRFENGHYYVAVIEQSRPIKCILLSDESEMIGLEETNVLLCSGQETPPEAVSKKINTVFLFCRGTLTRHDYSEGKPLSVHGEQYTIEDSKDTDEPSEEISPAEDESEHVKDTGIPVDEEVASANTTTEDETRKVSVPVGSSPAIKTDTEKPLEDVGPSYLLKMKDAPSDETFCTLISKLLNRPWSSKKELTSVIVQSVLLANGAQLEKDRPQASRFAAQLKLATHLLLGETPYSAAHLSSVFTDPEKDDKALLLSAYLFAMLTPSVPYDYNLQTQTEMFFKNYSDYFDSFTAFKPLFKELMNVRDTETTGFSPAFIASIGSTTKNEAFIESLRENAKNYLAVPSPKAHIKALPPLYNSCFGAKSDLHECMKIIADGREDHKSIEYVKKILEEYCDRYQDTFSVSGDRIGNRLDDEWGKIEVNKNTKVLKKPRILENHGRRDAIKEFTLRLELMCDWFNLMDRKGQNKSKGNLRTLKENIIEICSNIQNDRGWEKEPNANVLSWLLLFMKDYLNGEYSKLHVYSELLLTGAFPVGEDGSPNIDPNMAEIRYFEPWRNAIRHIVDIAAGKRNIEEVKTEILGGNIDSFDDEAGLKDNLHQLKMLGELVESEDEDYVITEAQLREAIDSADERTTRFKEKLELAYTYNQINETKKETLLAIMTQYKDDFYASMDFAAWRRFLEALEMQIYEYAADAKSWLRRELDQRLANNPDSALLLEANRLLEEDMNLAVTEECLNRYDTGEVELDDNPDLILHDIDYFEDFLKSETFDKLFQVCRRNDGRTLRSFGLDYLWKWKNFPHDWTQRLKDESITMISSWPSQKSDTYPGQIKTLFTCLGLDVKTVSKVIGCKEQMFQIKVNPTPKSMADYRHPIAAFGTQLKSPINVIVLYGNHTDKELVDTISSLDLGGISIVLIDRPFDAARRRMIGEIFHTQTSGLNPFLLVDQVLFMYLAMHQKTERLPALLKCTLPYTTYQPFVRDGGSVSDEMFCGRTKELATLIDLKGACVVYGGRQLGKTALLERVESLCSKPGNKAFAIYSSIVRIKDEGEVVSTLVSDIEKKTSGEIKFNSCTTLKKMCDQLDKMFRSGSIVSMHLLIDEVDDFLGAIADQAYRQLQPLVDLKRETRNNFKFVIAGLHNVCRAKNATRENGIFGQLGTPLCIKPLSPTDALKLLSRPLSYLGFQTDRYPQLKKILTNTNYYPGILQFFGYMLVETLSSQYADYYSAADGNPPFTLQDEQLGAVMNSSDLNKSIKDKFRWSLELDPRYFMIARCITMLYHYYENDRSSGSWRGFKINEIIEVAEMYEIHCLEEETPEYYKNLLDEMEEMGILIQPEVGMYRLRRSSFVDIIGENIDALEQEIINNNKEA